MKPMKAVESLDVADRKLKSVFGQVLCSLYMLQIK